MRRALLTLLLTATIACGSAGASVDPGSPGGAAGAGGDASGGAAGSGGTGAGGAAGTGLGLGAGGGAGSPGNPNENCGDVGKVIYVVTAENVLLSFQPQKAAFTVIGTLNCPSGPTASPFSMAVDRTGLAFVLYSDGNIFHVSTTDASCKPSGYKTGQGYSTFGMGWVSDAAGSSSETLYIIDYSSFGSGSSTGNKGLAKIDSMGSIHAVGNFDQGLTGRPAEVTGLGDGRLFGFFVDAQNPSNTVVAELDKTSAHVISSVPQNLQVGAWAFAFWGGSFYLFDSAGGGGHSRVHKYTPGMGTTQVVDDAGYEIVGAGVSTCAPLVEPPLG